MPAHWHRLPHFSGQCMPMHVAAYSHIHWHVLPLCFSAAQGDMWPRTVWVNCMRLHLATFSGILFPAGPCGRKGVEQYANTWGCIQMHTCAFVSPMLFGHIAQNQCTPMQGVHALAYVSPILFWATGRPDMQPRSTRENANVCGCMPPHALAYIARKKCGSLCQCAGIPVFGLRVRVQGSRFK